METLLENKTVNELTTAELTALLQQKQAEETAKRVKAREAYESLRDADVKRMVLEAQGLHDALGKFKMEAFNDIGTLYEMLQEHSARHAGGKGNVTLDSSDGQFRIAFKRQDQTRFDERSTQAEAHIMDFLLEEYPEGSNTSKMIRLMLERKKGELDKNNVLKLMAMKDDFDNANWKKGLELLQESIVPDHTRFYAEFYFRSVDGEWMPIVLNFSRL